MNIRVSYFSSCTVCQGCTNLSGLRATLSDCTTNLKHLWHMHRNCQKCMIGLGSTFKTEERGSTDTLFGTPERRSALLSPFVVYVSYKNSWVFYNSHNLQWRERYACMATSSSILWIAKQGFRGLSFFQILIGPWDGTSTYNICHIMICSVFLNYLDTNKHVFQAMVVGAAGCAFYIHFTSKQWSLTA